MWGQWRVEACACIELGLPSLYRHGKHDIVCLRCLDVILYDFIHDLGGDLGTLQHQGED